MGFVIIGGIIVFIVAMLIQAKQEKEQSYKNKWESMSYLNKQEFKATQTIDYIELNVIKKSLKIDAVNKKIAISSLFPTQNTDILNYEDIIECEIIEDANTIMKGGIGRAIAGGAIAGGVGAIVGANTRNSKNVVNKLQIRIVTKDATHPLYTIDIITTEIKKDDSIYKDAMDFANRAYATITAIINGENKEKDSSFIEKLEKLAKLKNDGVITEEEFKESKEKILKNKDI